MDCKKAKALLAEYSLGFLNPPTLSEQIDAHLDSCPTCAKRLRKIEAAALLVADLPAVEPPVDLWPAIWRSIGPLKQPAKGRSLFDRVRLVPARALALAGALAVAVIVFAVFFPFWSLKGADVPVAETGAVTYVQGHVSLAIGNPLADSSGLILVAGIASRQDAAICSDRNPATAR
jgi:hypothetical protein